MRGMVYETGGGHYRVRLENGSVVKASLRGKLKSGKAAQDRVVIGDRVFLEQLGQEWTIERVEQRKSQLLRQSKSKPRPKVLAANLDRTFMVVAAKDPSASPGLVDRLMVLGESSRITPTLVINKIDLPGAIDIARALEDLYLGIGYLVISVSAHSGRGIGLLEKELCEGVSTLIGPSGVGKSSILNAIDPELDLRTGELSRKGGVGRHTTVSARLISLACGGIVADTPGFGDVGFGGVPISELSNCFPEFTEHTLQCRFSSCGHVSEPECGVRTAVENGEITPSRFDSYLKARSELVDLGSYN